MKRLKKIQYRIYRYMFLMSYKKVRPGLFAKKFVEEYNRMPNLYKLIITELKRNNFNK